MEHDLACIPAGFATVCFYLHEHVEATETNVNNAISLHQMEVIIYAENCCQLGAASMVALYPTVPVLRQAWTKLHTEIMS